jgi:hypothetical protein
LINVEKRIQQKQKGKKETKICKGGKLTDQNSWPLNSDVKK